MTDMEERAKAQLRAAKQKLLKAKSERRHEEALEDINDLRQELKMYKLCKLETK